jgi:hypothetical protein
MKRKYFAYLHKNNHWVIKNYTTIKRFNEIIQDGKGKNSNIIGVIMPFELDVPEKDWEKKHRLSGSLTINMSEVPAALMAEHPALLYIKEIIGRVNWNKG